MDINSLFTSVLINVHQSVLDSLRSLHPELSRRVGPFMTCPGQGSLRVTCLGHSGDWGGWAAGRTLGTCSIDAEMLQWGLWVTAVGTMGQCIRDSWDLQWGPLGTLE